MTFSLESPGCRDRSAFIILLPLCFIWEINNPIMTLLFGGIFKFVLLLMDRKTSPSGARDGGTERPFVTGGCVPGLSMRVPDALAFHPVTSLKDAGRSPRLRTTSDTGGSLQGRCDKTAAAGPGPCETLPNSVSGKDTDPAGRPLS